MARLASTSLAAGRTAWPTSETAMRRSRSFRRREPICKRSWTSSRRRAAKPGQNPRGSADGGHGHGALALPMPYLIERDSFPANFSIFRLRIRALRENDCVLRSLWTEFPAQTVCVHALQEGAHAILVSTHEFGHPFGGRTFKHSVGIIHAAPARGGPSRAASVSQLVLDCPKRRLIWLGAFGGGPARVGLFRLEGSAAQGKRLADAKTAHLLAGRWRGANDPLVDSRGAASR